MPRFHRETADRSVGSTVWLSDRPARESADYAAALPPEQSKQTRSKSQRVVTLFLTRLEHVYGRRNQIVMIG